MREEVRRNHSRLYRTYKIKYLKLISQVSKCKMCGKKFLRIDHRVYCCEQSLLEYVKEKDICYECAFWTSLIDNPPDGLQVTGGKCYKVLPFIDNPTIYMTLGGNGKVRYFLTNEYKLIKSNDVWLIGAIPQRFKSQLPETGWFCSKKAYEKFLSFDGRCYEKGCFDRYKCLRFRAEIELDEGAFNTLPQVWNYGDEHCRDFINTDELDNYVSPIKPKNGTNKEND